ncbi:MAG TPA: precorrin-6A synthase (deacetylating) [Humibacillus sp.]|nr:precorrin-6A synthase (deacetylating) [Humibacillus sp.]
MIKRIRVIGLGLGNPDHVTGEAARALATLDVLVVADGGGPSSDLAGARQAICDAFMPADHAYRVVEVADPRSEPDAEPDTAAYAAVIDALDDHETTVGVLVWGDPALHDSTIRVVDTLVGRWAARGVVIEHDVIAGISAPQLLAARHRISLSRSGAPVHITTGPRLVDEFDLGLGDVVVMLDEHLACSALVDAFPDLELSWGAYLGTPDELLLLGRLSEVIDEVRRVRADARARHGWILDTYLLRQPADAPVRAHAGPTFPPFPDVTAWEPLTDGVVTVRPLTADDWRVLLAESNNAESLRWGFDGQPLTEAEARHKAAEAVREWRHGRVVRFVIVDAATGEGAGVLMVIRMGPPGIGVVGYGVVPDFRGRGFSSRALRLVSAWVFAHTDLQRLELGHKVGNVASGRAAERAGFVAEGRLAGRLPNPDGTRSDEITYVLGRPDA